MIVPDLFASKAHTGYIKSLSIDSGNSQFLLSGGADSSVTIWDLNIPESCIEHDPSSLQPLAKLEARRAHKFGISKAQWWPFDNAMFLTGSFDNTVKIWDSEDLEEVYSFDLDNKVYNFDINPIIETGVVAVALNHPHIRLIDLKSGGFAQVLVGHDSGSVCCVKWSPTREYMLASGGSDGCVRIWDIRQASQQVAVMDLSRTTLDKPLTPLQFRKSHRAICNGLLWHPTGDEIMSIGLDNKARIWDLTGTPGGGHNKSVNFGPLFQMRRQQTLEPQFFGDEDTVLLPSETGDILCSQFSDGKLIERLVPLGREVRLNRQACVAARAHDFYSGTCDGSILRWQSKS